MKSQRAYQFVVVFLLMLPAKLFSQQQMPLFAQKIPHKQPSFLMQTQKLTTLSIANDQLLDKDPFLSYHSLRIVRADLYTVHYGFFCRKELEFEKLTYVPFRFRLGSLEYVNKMEGKESCGLVGFR
jgi:hypothetical protein